MRKLEEAQARLERILVHWGDKGQEIIERSIKIRDPLKRVQYLRGSIQRIKSVADDLSRYFRPKISVQEFLESEEYMGKGSVLWPKVKEAICDLCTGDYVEAVLTGGIGSAKTTVALYALAYKVYEMSILRDPHEEFGLDPASEIELVFQSLTSATAKSVDYSRFRVMIESSPYFRNHFPPDSEIKSELHFPRNIRVKPISGLSTAAIGENVIGGLIDEVNYMKVIEDSVRNPDGGVYDQATENYRALARRRESRFLLKGHLPGILCLVSSKRYPGQFTDRKQAEAKENPKIFVYDKKIWDVKPLKNFTGKWFDLYLGDVTRKPRILKPGEAKKIPKEDQDLIVKIPEEYRNQFETDMYASIRDIAGAATLALHPFIANAEAIEKCFGKVKSVLSREDCDFVDTKLKIRPRNFRNLKRARFIHIDLATTGDSAGVACGYVDKFVQIKRGKNEMEIMPHIVFDFVLEVKPPRNDEINFSKIRSLIYRLKELGLPIKWVSMDSWQSTDTKQILYSKGYITGVVSVDKTTIPYDILKSGLMDNRVMVPEHEKAHWELRTLERDEKKGKIDHPPLGCFLGSTEVMLYSGGSKSFEELVHDWESGIVNTIVTYDAKDGSYVKADALKPHITKSVLDTVEIELDDGSVFECTPEHLILLKSGAWVAASLLKEDDDIQSLHRSEGDP